MRPIVLGIAALLSLGLQITDAAARGGFGGGGFHGGAGFGGFHGGANFGGFHGFAPSSFAGLHRSWHGGGVGWATASRPGWGWHNGWHSGWGWQRHPIWRWGAAGALGYAAYGYGYYDPYDHGCPLIRRTVWDGYSHRIAWARACDPYW
jgi:hypothetical protein